MRTIFGCASEVFARLPRDEQEEAVRETALRLFGKKSLRALTRKECFQLLDTMRGGRAESAQRRHAQAHHGRKGYDAAGEPAYLAGDRERAMLKAAAERRGWSDETLEKFIKRQLGGRALRTLRDFNRVWWGLRSMNRRDGLE